MTSTPRDRKKMWTADVLLQRAAKLIPVALPEPAQPADLDSIDVDAARDANLRNLGFLESVGRDHRLRGGFWRDLMRACELLDRPEWMPALTAKYHAALQRVGRTTAPPTPRFAGRV